jgi:hypothetical protein
LAREMKRVGEVWAWAVSGRMSTVQTAKRRMARGRGFCFDA